MGMRPLIGFLRFYDQKIAILNNIILEIVKLRKDFEEKKL